MACALCNRKTEPGRRVCEACRTRIFTADAARSAGTVPTAVNTTPVLILTPNTSPVVFTPHSVPHRTTFDPGAALSAVKALFVLAVALTALYFSVRHLQQRTTVPTVRPIHTVPIPVGEYRITDFRA